MALQGGVWAMGMGFLLPAAFVAAIAAASPVTIAQTVKVGLINTYSGPVASGGEQIEHGIRLYMKLHQKDLPPGVTIELIRRDDTGPNPEVAKRLAQELIVRDKVRLLTGFYWTPNALAVAPLATEAKIPLIIMNASTAYITTKSPYIVRVSFSTWQTTYPLGIWAAKSGLKDAYTLVSDYGPGIDNETAFAKGFGEAGGTIVGAVRMPVSTPDFVAFLQRAKDVKPDAVFVFVPESKEAANFMKAYNDLGLKSDGIKLLGTGGLTPDNELSGMGDNAIGTITMQQYSAAGKRPANLAFVADYHAEYGATEEPTFYALDAYDGMAAIFHVVIAQNGDVDPDKTMELLKGWKYDSPRGPFMIDPETRDIVQNEYLRRVEKVDGRLQNTEFETIPMVKDPWKEINKVK
jgi:branched-chain amino acid transport system substrate-binding protein